jgi:hypothetical protein
MTYVKSDCAEKKKWKQDRACVDNNHSTLQLPCADAMLDLCEQVWEGILGYLETHHHARLFETGDRRVQKWIVLAPREFNPNGPLDNVHSSLVCDLLVPYADRARVTWTVVERLCAAKPRTRILTVNSVVGEYFDRAAYPHRRRLVHDLTAFERLEAIDFSSRVYVDLLLPPTLTSLKLYDSCFQLVQNMSSLVNLTHLSCPFVDEQLESLTADCWPVTLTSLEMFILSFTDDPLDVQPNLSALPSSLRHLALSDYSGSHNGRVLDVMPPPACPALESFELFGTPCELKRRGQRFPCTLKRLVIGGAQCIWDTGRGSLLDAIAESSISHLDIQLMSKDVVLEFADDYLRMLYIVLPRLDEESLLILVETIVTAFYRCQPLVDACIRSLIKHGYCTNFFDFVSHSYRSDFSKLIGAANKCENQALVRRYLAKSTRARDRLGRLLLYHVTSDERALATKWMIDNGLRIFVRTFDLCNLDQDVIGKLVELKVDCDVEQVVSALAKWRFDSLCNLEIPRSWPGSSDVVVSALHSNRDRFPSLTYFRNGGSAVSEESAALLAEMRLYHCPAVPGEYRYRVTPPVNRTSSV